MISEYAVFFQELYIGLFLFNIYFIGVRHVMTP